MNDELMRVVCGACGSKLEFDIIHVSTVKVVPCPKCIVEIAKGALPNEPEMVSGVDMAAGPDTTATMPLRKAVDRFGNEIVQEADEGWPLWEVWLEGAIDDRGHHRPTSYFGSYFGPTLAEAVSRAIRKWGGETIPTLDRAVLVRVNGIVRRVFSTEFEAKRLYGW